MAGYNDFEDYSDLEYMAYIEGFLVPIAHIKAIGWVELSEPMPDETGLEREQYFFRVYLDQPVSGTPDNATRDLAVFFDTQEEAEMERLNLAGRVNDYYDVMRKITAFGNGGGIH